MHVYNSIASQDKKFTFMYDHFLQGTFLVSDFNNPLVNSIGGDKAIDNNRLSLANTMASILRLQILLRVLEKIKLH